MAGGSKELIFNLLFFSSLFLLEVGCDLGDPDCQIRLRQGIIPADDDDSKSFANMENLGVTEDEENAFLNGTFEMKKTVDSTSIVTVITVCKAENGRCEVIFTHCVDNICPYLGSEGDTMYPELNQLTFQCPIQDGKYVVEKLIVDKSKIELKPSHEGLYNIKAEMYTTPEGEGCDSKEKTHLNTWTTSCTVECYA